MAITRISTLSLQQRTVSDFTKVQQDLAELQNQISSGVKTDNFRGLVGDVEQFTSIEAEINKLETIINNNTENVSRMRTARNIVAEIITIADDVENFMTRRNGASKDTMQFEQQILDMRLNLTRELNATFGNRFLFGGTRTNVPPVVDDPVPQPGVVGIPDDSYYQGSKENLIIRAEKNFEIEFDVRADDEAFQKVMGAIAYAIEAHQEDDDDKFFDALDMIRDGQRDLTAMQAKLDARLVTLEQIDERNESLRIHFTNTQETLIRTDVLSASTELAVNETILQATFQSFARVNNLRLVDFLN